MNPIKILILTANPKIPGYEPLRLDAEVRQIEEALKRSQHRDRFQLETQLATRTEDLRRALLDHQPQIVHFSGHGSGENGLVLENDAGTMQLVSSETLEHLFAASEYSEVECVLLNACYSEIQAKAIHQIVDCVIGMNKPIGDKAAVQFAIGFYDALGAGRTYEEAYKFGKSAISGESIPHHEIPVLMYRKRRSINPPTHQSAPQPQSTQKSAAGAIADLPVRSSQSQVIGNITSSGNDSPLYIPQPSGHATVSQDNSRQSMTISGGTISGQVGQAGQNLTQTQYQNQSEATKQLSSAEVVELIAQIETLLKGSALPSDQKDKAVTYLGAAKEEANSEEPDKQFAAKSLQKTTKILKDASEAVDAGQSLWSKVEPILGQLLPWLGVASHFFGL